MRVPEQILIAPQDIRTADPTITGNIYAGWFAFAGRAVNTHGRSPFDIPPPSPLWQAQLHGFGWLRHLRASNTPLAKLNARALVQDWITSCSADRYHPAWRADITARRLMALLAQSPILLENASHGLWRRFMKIISLHGTMLMRAYMLEADDERRLLVSLALAELALCVSGQETLRERTNHWLETELNRQILPDGGHISRNPALVPELLLDLLPLRQIYAARGLPVPAALLNAIDRMMPMVRLLRHSDGTMGLFNGMGTSEPDTLATILACDDNHAAPLENAPWSGYQRLVASDTIIIADTGTTPPPGFSRQAHAGALSFELSCARQKIITNCGAPDASLPALREAARTSAAHSTLIPGDTSSCRFAAHTFAWRWLRGEIVHGPSGMESRRQNDDGFIVLDMAHDGYQRRFGLVHRRQLQLSGDGLALHGEDVLDPVGPQAESGLTQTCHIRFHVPSGVELVSNDDEPGVFILLPDGQVWLLAADDVPLHTEESLFMAAAGGPRASRQIVLTLRAGERAAVTWRCTRVQGPTPPETGGEPSLSTEE
jgi:uncharacterized heparinase superfamily protein